MNYSISIPLISRRLVDLITQAAGCPVSNFSPQDAMLQGGASPLNLFLLHIKEEALIRNIPPGRLDPRAVPQPVFSLLYLLHTTTPDAESALGAALDAITTNPVQPIEPPPAQLVLALVTFSLEELAHIWQACQTTLRPSIGIQARIDIGLTL